ncbi:hypothetical protein GQ600_7894 [Phytophthora cactorum]|nr:hypothetical protein GQ600_7894 [Phytophthora cactorum]
MRFGVFVVLLVATLVAYCTIFASAENVTLVNSAGKNGRLLCSDAVNPDNVSKNVAAFVSKLTKNDKAKRCYICHGESSAV